MAATPKLGRRAVVPRAGDPVVIKPSWQSDYPDTGDPTKLGPAAWNTERFVTGGTPGDVLLRDPSSSTGASWGTLPPIASPEEVAAGDSATLGDAATHSDGNDATTLESANSFAEQCEAEALADAKAYADAQDGTTLAAANSHSNTQDAATLASAKAYTDAKPLGLKKRTTLATAIPLPVTTPVNTDVDLWTWTLAANAMAVDGDVLQIQSWGQFLAVNAGSRTIALVLGSLTIGTLVYSGSQLKTWMLNATLVRASAGAQSVLALTDGDPSVVARVQLATLDLTQPQTLALRARQGGQPPSPSLQVAGATVSQW